MAQTIRTAQVAKQLGISSRKLREIISEVNFGVKPTDREIPLNLAMGIARFAATKLKIECPNLMPEEEGEDALSPLEKEETHEKEVIEIEKPLKQASFSTLKKMQKISKKSQEDTQKRKEEAEKKDANHGPKVMRKIEISEEEKQKAAEKRAQNEEVRKQKKQAEEDAIIERKLQRKKRQDEIFKKKEGVVEIPGELTVKEFSEKIGVPIPSVISTLVKNGMPATINQAIDFDTASIIAAELEVEVKKQEQEANSEDILKGNLQSIIGEEEAKDLIKRPSVIAVMGHVDHGKTSILDAIRKTRVVSGEAGGITQHIGAYQVEKKGEKITFLDTPGHEAFTSMRARGAKTADIAILVVAADDGIKPQTVEAINHAKAANLPIIVAANKIDKESANLDKLKSELSEYGLQTEDWGGTTPLVPVSAITGQGIDDLLELIILQSEIMELKANPSRLAIGTVIEAHVDPSLGPVATVLINTGTMKMRDHFVLGTTWGRVKTIVNDEGKKLQEVSPAGAARISGIENLPNPGDIFQVLKNEKEIKKKRLELEALREQEKKQSGGLVDIVGKIRSGNMKNLNLVIKADTTGSLEAIEQALKEIGNEEVQTKIIHSAVGTVSENDIMMASASKALVLAFHTKTTGAAKQIAEKEKIEIREHKIIYAITEEITDILEGMLEPEIVQTITGILNVKGIFYTKGKMKIIGGKVENGYLMSPQQVKIFREEEEIAKGKISIIQHFEEKVKEIKAPQECGLQIEGVTIEVAEGDRIEGYTEETIIKKLEKKTK